MGNYGRIRGVVGKSEKGVLPTEFGIGGWGILESYFFRSRIAI